MSNVSFIKAVASEGQMPPTALRTAPEGVVMVWVESGAPTLAFNKVTKLQSQDNDTDRMKLDSVMVSSSGRCLRLDFGR